MEIKKIKYGIKKTGLFICIFLILNSCSTFVAKELNYKSLNKEWTAYYYTPGKYFWQMGFIIENKEKLPYVEIKIENFRSTYQTKNVFWLLPIPITDSYSTNYKNCTPNFYLNFQTTYSINETREKNPFTKKIAENYFKNNKIIFDTSKVFIIKNGRKYKISLTKLTKGTILDPSYPLYDKRKDSWIDDYKLDVSLYLLKQVENNQTGWLSVGNQFTSPFGCQALEGTTLIIGGIYLNGEELEPIEIKLSYKKID